MSSPTRDPDYDAALASYEAGLADLTRDRLQAVLRRFPPSVPALLLAGVVEAQHLRLDAALGFFDRALALQPGNPRAQFNKAAVLLQRGEWEAGLPLYESRWALAEFRPVPPFPTGPTPWRGRELLAGKTILLRCEQGMGDTLQFCRYVPLLAARGAEVVLVAQRPLVTLLADLPGVTRIITDGAAEPACDFECPLLSLPLAFGTTPTSIPQQSAYLISDAGKVSEWRSRLGPATALRIGLTWQGTAKHVHDRHRSLSLQQLLAHLPREHEYHSLQKQLPASEARLLRAQPWIADHAPDLHDFSDTAALCACLDLIITVDTSVAHLSAGLGKPTWILLHHSAGWRWLLDRNDTPWYPSAILFRQRQLHDWSEVCTRVGLSLRRQISSARDTGLLSIEPQQGPNVSRVTTPALY